MNVWFTAPDAPVRRDFIKRFDPQHWLVEFPRGSMASIVTGQDGHSLTVRCAFLRKGDLVGLSFESVDRFAHPAHAREAARDYSRCKLAFRWQSEGLIALNAINGPTLTIEGRDAQGAPRTWYVRLWNYADGDPDDAVVEIDFDNLDGGFMFPEEADRVDPRDIDRMFISLVPPGYQAGSMSLWPTPPQGSVSLSDIRCAGSGSVIAINDAVLPEHDLRIATAYDDCYHLPPERIIAAVERLGYRKIINHYIGMSHYFGLGGDGLVDPAAPFCGPALAWHRDFARAAKARGYDVIWSLSYEILDQFCPEPWKQRAFDGSPALTGYDPPSTLVSPASAEAISFLAGVATACVDIGVEAGLHPRVQIGEPWWWVTASGGICLYDDSATARFGGNPLEIPDVSQPLSTDQMALLDQGGELLAQSTASIAAAVKSANANAQTLLLAFLPGLLDPTRPEVKRANLPVGWAKPAFDVLQLEDYDWVTSGRSVVRRQAIEQASNRLGYSNDEQHYLAGFVSRPERRDDWYAILAAAREEQERGAAEVFLWALPQVLRDGLSIFGKEPSVQPIDDVAFPIEIGAEASVTPAFSTAITTSASGYEHRNVNWSQGRLRFDAGPGVRGDAEMQQLIAFFRARRGAAVGFRFRDPYDFSSSGMSDVPAATDQLIGVGDGTRTRFPLIKSYGAGEQRRITRPVAGSILVSVAGVSMMTGWMLEPGGIIAFDTTPTAAAQVRAGFLFDVPVRFAEDRLEINRASFLAGEAPSVPLIEIREDLH